MTLRLLLWSRKYGTPLTVRSLGFKWEYTVKHQQVAPPPILMTSYSTCTTHWPKHTYFIMTYMGQGGICPYCIFSSPNPSGRNKQHGQRADFEFLYYFLIVEEMRYSHYWSPQVSNECTCLQSVDTQIQFAQTLFLHACSIQNIGCWLWFLLPSFCSFFLFTPFSYIFF